MTRVSIDGNEAAARVAHKTNSVIAIYPITPASAMGELADAWSAAHTPNLWGEVPVVVEMQSEAGAAGVVHGSAMAGALTTTFTASQGLLLMLPNMYKLAGELTPTVIHVAARTVATHALSIFGDHSDVMAARTTGFALLSASSVQEAHDFALVAQAATLESRVPFLHFFDGFRTSHEINQVELLSDDDLRAVIDEEAVAAHLARGLTPDHPTLRGSAQNPDVFFQAREASNRQYDAIPGVVADVFDRIAARTGRRYHLVDYHGAPDADRIVVLMGSGSATTRAAVDALVAGGEKVGVVTVRLFRPFPVDEFLAAVPPSVRRVAVLDRTKEPGATGEPLFQDVVCAFAGSSRAVPFVSGGRYGLSSKEFTPAMAKAVFDDLGGESPRRRFTVGIDDDVTGLSLPWDPEWSTEPPGTRAVFFGLGSDGTVGANKNSVKIIGESGRYAQGFFVYDSKKSGSMTVSHLRFGDEPIDAPYLIGSADFVACHQFSLLSRVDVLRAAAPGAIVLLNSPWPRERTWAHIPAQARAHIQDRNLQVWAVDASRVAREAGIPGRTNTILQTCFFHLSGLMTADEAKAAVKRAVAKTYAKRGAEILASNDAAVDAALTSLFQVEPDQSPAPAAVEPLFAGALTGCPAATFVGELLAGNGDALPVSAFAADGRFPTATAKLEKRSIAENLPVWDPEICIDCGKCALDCPHAAIRMKVFPADGDGGPPPVLQTKAFRSKDLPGRKLTIAVAPDDCTGCGICVDVCPATSKADGHRSLELVPKESILDEARARWTAFETIPNEDRVVVPVNTPKGSQLLEPLFEFAGACAGCGETPYLKLLSQLFGDRMLVANATGCSSIYGGNLPTTPWTVNADGRGPAWANSLFEDNAEFGYGLRLGVDRHTARARDLVVELGDALDERLRADLLADPVRDEPALARKRAAVDQLRGVLATLDTPAARELDGIADFLVDKIVWIVGGDGWAYDIGFGGLDHVLTSGADVNILVLDTEVYSNTGGQASKATPRGAVAKFASSGEHRAKKELGLIAASYGCVYVAQIAMGANEIQTVKALAEAARYPGPSLVIAYAHCIEHGLDMATGMHHQHDAVAAGYWPLWRFDPSGPARGEPSFRLDCRRPNGDLAAFYASENRFASLARIHPDHAARLSEAAAADLAARWSRLDALAATAT